MQIDRLTFRNFRNLDQVDLAAAPGVNVVWGANGQGKTNLLEGIYLFSYFKSFRGAGNGDLVGPHHEAGKVNLQTSRAGLERELELNVSAVGRTFLLDGKPPRPVEALLEAVRAVLFAPDELHQLRTVPTARRALLDRAVFQIEPSYLGRAIEYERILKQRNRLLRDRVDEMLLQPWTEALIRSGALVRQARREFLDHLAPALTATHRQLSGDNASIAIAYPVASQTLGEYEAGLRQELRQAASKDIRLGQTCVGPHRDDPVFLLDEQPIRHVASQGEWRTIILSFKIALLRLLQERLGTPPLLLLDDMAAELDRQRQGRLFELLAGCGAQVFVTTTDPEPFRRLRLDSVTYFQMRAGRVMPEPAHD